MKNHQNDAEKINLMGFEFEMYVTSDVRVKYVDMVYEEMTAKLIRQNAKGVASFIDVGAHIGFYDVLVGLSNPNCTLFAFEPVPENIAILEKNLDLNKVDALAIQSAVSDIPGRSEIQVSEFSDQSGFNANPDEGTTGNIEVDVIRLDQYLDMIPDGPLMIKIDTEGNEIRVLEGMRGIIERFDDVRLIIGFNPRYLEANGDSAQALLDKIIEFGFDVFIIHDEEKRYEKYHIELDWHVFIGNHTYKNLYCVKKERSLNLLFFSHSAAYGGAEKCLLELVGSLVAKYGLVCTVVLPHQGPLQTMLEDRGASPLFVSYHLWCSVNPPLLEETDAMMIASYENTCEFIPSIEKISPDIILSNTLVIPWGAVAALKLDCPSVWWVHEFGQLDHGLEFFFSFQTVLEVIQEASNHIIANSSAVRIALFKEVEPASCTVAYYNNIIFSKSETTNEEFFNYPDSTKLIITGRVTKAKGQDDAVHAIRRLVQSGFNVELCIVGSTDSTFAHGLINLLRLEKLEDRIHFTGHVDNVRPIIEQADFGLTCSRNEAFGRITVEAMLLGKPVIGTNTGGTPELIDDGITGFLYSPGDVDQLAEKIAFLVEHPEEIREFGERARQIILPKLAERPDDDLIHQICLTLKGSRNPISRQLMRLMMDWQQSIYEQQVQALTEQVAERDGVLAVIYSTRSWRLTAPWRWAGQWIRSAISRWRR